MTSSPHLASDFLCHWATTAMHSVSSIIANKAFWVIAILLICSHIPWPTVKYSEKLRKKILWFFLIYEISLFKHKSSKADMKWVHSYLPFSNKKINVYSQREKKSKLWKFIVVVFLVIYSIVYCKKIYNVADFGKRNETHCIFRMLYLLGGLYDLVDP